MATRTRAAVATNTFSLPPAPLAVLIDTVARIGTPGISFGMDPILTAGAAQAARAIRDAGLDVATVTHGVFAITSAEETAAAREAVLRTIEVAAEVGAETITMTTGSRGRMSWAEAADRFVDGAAPLAEVARQAGVALAIEPTSHLYADVSIVHRLTETTLLARKAGLGVIIDIFACWTDADIMAAIAEAGSSIVLVQVADYVYGDRGLPCRAVPGDGAIPFEALVPAIVATGFTGFFDLEIMGPRLKAEGEEAGLRRAAALIDQLAGQA